MKAAQLREVDMDYRNHLQAYLNLIVKAKKKVGKNKMKPVYTTFRKFYDYDAALEKVLRKRKIRFAGIGKLLRKERR